MKFVHRQMCCGRILFSFSPEHCFNNKKSLDHIYTPCVVVGLYCRVVIETGPEIMFWLDTQQQELILNPNVQNICSEITQKWLENGGMKLYLVLVVGVSIQSGYCNDDIVTETPQRITAILNGHFNGIYIPSMLDIWMHTKCTIYWCISKVCNLMVWNICVSLPIMDDVKPIPNNFFLLWWKTVGIHQEASMPFSMDIHSRVLTLFLVTNCAVVTFMFCHFCCLKYMVTDKWQSCTHHVHKIVI